MHSDAPLNACINVSTKLSTASPERQRAVPAALFGDGHVGTTCSLYATGRSYHAPPSPMSAGARTGSCRTVFLPGPTTTCLRSRRPDRSCTYILLYRVRTRVRDRPSCSQRVGSAGLRPRGAGRRGWSRPYRPGPPEHASIGRATQ